MNKTKTIPGTDPAFERAASALGFGKADKRVASMFGARAKAEQPKAEEPKIPELTPEELILADADSDMRWLDYGLLDDNPWQPRDVYEESETADMRDSLNAVGQMQPGICRPHPDQKLHPGRFQIAVAHRRTRGVEAGGNAGTGRPNAHLYIGKVWFRVANLNDLEMQVLAARENTDRVNLNPMQLAVTYSNIRKKLADGTKKLTWADVSKLTGLGARQMRRYADLLELPEAAQKKIRDGLWNERHGRALLSFEKEDPRQAILTRAIEKEGLSGSAAERKAGQIRAVYATQREMNIADTAQKSHETTVAHQAAQVGAENRAALEAGRSHLTLVPPPEAAPATESLKPAQTETAQTEVAPANTGQAILNSVLTNYENRPEPAAILPPAPTDPIAELQSIAARLEFLARDIETIAVVSPGLSRGVKGGVDDCYISLNKMLDALGGEHEK